MSDNEAILQAIKATHSMLERHIEEETVQIGRFMAGFPNGDPISHCNAHTEWIEQVMERKEFWKKMRFELVKWGLFGFLGWALFQLWTGFLHGPAK